MTGTLTRTAPLIAYVDELKSYLPQHLCTNETVSSGSVGWHTEHILLVLDVIIEALCTSNPNDYQWKFNWKRTMIATINRIPHGKVKAPKVVQPQENFTEQDLAKHIEQTRKKIARLEDLQRNHHFVHPFLGTMNAKPAIKFLGIHTFHHLKIIRGIVATS